MTQKPHHIVATTVEVAVGLPAAGQGKQEVLGLAILLTSRPHTPPLHYAVNHLGLKHGLHTSCPG